MTAGVNYPWRRYGGDFGPTIWGTTHGVRADHAAIAGDFAAMAAAGVDVVRWFLFTDARGGLRVDAQGWPAGFLDGALDDLDALFTLALDAGLRVVPVLFDHTLVFAPTETGGARVGGHYAWLADPEGQARLLECVITPLFARYGARGSHGHLGPAVFAWDLLNEPDWIVAEHHPNRRVPAPVPFDVLAAWVRAASATVREQRAGAVTIGNARLRFVSWWDDPAFGLDFLQAHTYYDPDHDFDLLATPAGALGLTRPIVIGECSARGDAEDLSRHRPAISAVRLAEEAVALGYAGAWPWSWRGVDTHGPLVHDDARRIRAAVDARLGRDTTRRA
ncbi:MAG: hypothetical protein JNL48_01485 [Acidobacteria bacterium]|nr:hypothetical protein [Acidobacteriota bacterium]